MEQYQNFLKSLVDLSIYFLQIGLPVLAVYLFTRWSLAKIKIVEYINTWDKKNYINEIIRIAVLGAEQAKVKNLIEDKKTYVLEWVENYLFERGIKIDLKELDLLVETAVRVYINNQDKKV